MDATDVVVCCARTTRGALITMKTAMKATQFARGIKVISLVGRLQNLELRNHLACEDMKLFPSPSCCHPDQVNPLKYSFYTDANAGWSAELVSRRLWRTSLSFGCGSGVRQEGDGLHGTRPLCAKHAGDSPAFCDSEYSVNSRQPDCLFGARGPMNLGCACIY